MIKSLLLILFFLQSAATAPTNLTGVVVTSPVPRNAIRVEQIQALTNWEQANDTGVGTGTSIGAMSLVTVPSEDGAAREFSTTYTDFGGERYWVSFGADTTAANFFYDGWIYLPSSTDVANLELDMNQVTANGQTIIYGVQCDGYSSTWDYTENAGTPENYDDEWVHSSQPCNPRSWSLNTWHHVQLLYSQGGAGKVTYKSIWLDGAEQDINATVPSSFVLGWGSTLLTNLQVDGAGMSGSSTVYLDDLTIYRW